MSSPSATSWWKTRRSRGVFLGGAVTTAVGLAVWWFWFHPYVTTDDARIAATLVRIASQGTAGTIEKIGAEEGTRVKKGDILIELDHREAEARLARAQARFGLASRELKRTESLLSQNGIAERERDRTRAETQTAEAEMKLAQVALDNTTLRSPIDGIVVQKTAEVGNVLEPGQTALTVADIDDAWVAANIEETAVGEVKVGQPVSISVDEGGHLSGKVSEVREAAAAQFALIPADNAAGNFTKLVQRIPIKVALDPHSDRALRVGQSVEIRIRVK